jgi:hypothetical protein
MHAGATVQRDGKAGTLASIHESGDLPGTMLSTLSQEKE